MDFDLKRFRKDFDLKQSDIADILGISQNFISKVERGIDPFPNPHYITLEKKYGYECLAKYILDNSDNLESHTIIGNDNISSTATMASGRMHGSTNNIDTLNQKIKELEIENKKLRDNLYEMSLIYGKLVLEMIKK